MGKNRVKRKAGRKEFFLKKEDRNGKKIKYLG